MSGDGLRVPLDVALPTDMDPTLRATLVDAFRRINVQLSQLSQRTAYINADHTAGEDLVLADANTATLTVSLVPASKWVDKVVRVKKVDPSANTVKIVSAGGEVEGTATVSIATQYDVLSFMSDGKNWYQV